MFDLIDKLSLGERVELARQLLTLIAEDPDFPQKQLISDMHRVASSLIFESHHHGVFGLFELTTKAAEQARKASTNVENRSTANPNHT